MGSIWMIIENLILGTSKLPHFLLYPGPVSLSLCNIVTVYFLWKSLLTYKNKPFILFKLII